MARVLVVGCGCRGQELARALVADGHVARGTTRSRARFDAIAAAGAEPVLADPDRVGTLVSSLDAVAIVVWLLGAPSGDRAALHGPRLRALLEKLVDTPVRGFVHDAAGEGVSEIVSEAAGTWAIRTAEIAAGDWPESGRAAVRALLDSPQRQ